MQPTFQSTHESVSRDEPKINGFPVPGGTTPSRGFLEGSVGWRGDRPSGFFFFFFRDGSEWEGRWPRPRGGRRRGSGWWVGSCEEHGGVFEFPKWQQWGKELATSQSSHCLLFTRTGDSKQWHTLSLGTLWLGQRLKLTLEIWQWVGLPLTSKLRYLNRQIGLGGHKNSAAVRLFALFFNLDIVKYLIRFPDFLSFAPYMWLLSADSVKQAPRMLKLIIPLSSWQTHKLFGQPEVRCHDNTCPLLLFVFSYHPTPPVIFPLSLPSPCVYVHVPARDGSR